LIFLKDYIVDKKNLLIKLTVKILEMITTLKDYIVENIFGWLTVNEVLRLQILCKHVYNVVKHPNGVWKFICERRGYEPYYQRDVISRYINQDLLSRKDFCIKSIVKVNLYWNKITKMVNIDKYKTKKSSTPNSIILEFISNIEKELGTLLPLTLKYSLLVNDGFDNFTYKLMSAEKILEQLLRRKKYMPTFMEGYLDVGTMETDDPDYIHVLYLNPSDNDSIEIHESSLWGGGFVNKLPEYTHILKLLVDSVVTSPS
jgi:hypothetical protein